MALLVGGDAGVIVIIAVRVVVSAARGEAQVTGRRGEIGIDELRLERAAIEDGKGGAGLKDGDVGHGPAAESPTFEAVAELDARQLKGGTYGEAVPDVVR